MWLREVANREIATINMQVLNELCHVVLRKFPAVAAEDLRAWVADLREWGDAPVDHSVAEGAWSIRDEYGYSWFDCLLLAAARNLGCTHFLSEDLASERSVRGMVIVDPISTPPSAVLD